MNIKHKKELFMSLALLGATSCSASVFATNPYGIVYSGGEPLSENNVQIRPDLTADLTPIIKTGSITEEKNSDTPRLKRGYVLVGGKCKNINYLKITASDPIQPSEKIIHSIYNNRYRMDVNIERTYIEKNEFATESDDDNPQMNVIFYDTGLGAGYSVYSDEECQEMSPDYNNGRKYNVFVETKIKVYENKTNELFKSNRLYFGITDIDARQSYKILNSDNLLVPNNMYAENAASLQPSDPEITTRNMYVSDGNYIYSPNVDYFNITEPGNDVFVNVNTDVQEEGLRVVFGYSRGGAASTLVYYAKQYTVNYLSEQNGEIVGIETEDVIAGGIASGSEAKPQDGYQLKYWTADVDIELDDGTTIKAGQPITTEQLPHIVVNQDINLTAFYETDSTPAVPDTGASTKDTSVAQVVTISLLGILSVALIIRAIPFILHKKVKFN
ncbi:MAG: hypothetical protein Q4A70_03745 [Candidatus Saccharibacteria bacterium]|nr:hypothetical protein [Candidatus Saccharibacteria bacterium]